MRTVVDKTQRYSVATTSESSSAMKWLVGLCLLFLVAAAPAVAGTVAYVTDGRLGFKIIDVSIPANPTLLGGYDTPGETYGIAVAGTRAYVTITPCPPCNDSLAAGLMIFDISNPANPSLLGSYATPGGATDVAIAGNIAYVSEYAVGLRVINVSNPASPTLCGTYDTPGSGERVVVAGSPGVGCTVPQVGSVAGHVVADCPSAGTPLLGVTIDAFKVGSGDLVGTAATDGSGSYLIGNLPVGQYTVTVVTPLDYSAASSELSLTVTSGQTTTGDFSLHCLAVARNQQSMGFWKHQVGVATGGNGHAQISPTTLCSYLDLIAAHFNSNAINQVVVYQPPSSGVCADKLQVARTLLDLQGSVAMIARARQQLMSLLLNVAAGYISQMQRISADGATVSQAITYCDNLIDNPSGDYERAKTIADMINNGQQVPAGMIPLGTQNIAYAQHTAGLEFHVTPNPTTGGRSFNFVLGKSGPVSLVIYDVSGRRVTGVFAGVLAAGRQTIRWQANTPDGAKLQSGQYFARLSTSTGTQTINFIQGGQ